MWFFRKKGSKPQTPNHQHYYNPVKVWHAHTVTGPVTHVSSKCSNKDGRCSRRFKDLVQKGYFELKDFEDVWYE